MSKSMKIAVAFIVIVLVTALIVGLLSLTRIILGASYNSAELVETLPTEVDFEYATSIVYSNPNDEFSVATLLYSKAELEERQKLYLGKSYDVWFPIIKIAESNYKDVVKGLNNAGLPVDEATMFCGEVSKEGLKSVGKLSMSDGLSLVGMCDDTTLLFSYMQATSEKPILVVVDASELELPTYRTSLYSFGDTFSVYLKKGCFLVQEFGSYTILYIKG